MKEQNDRLLRSGPGIGYGYDDPSNTWHFGDARFDAEGVMQPHQNISSAGSYGQQTDSKSTSGNPSNDSHSEA